MNDLVLCMRTPLLYTFRKIMRNAPATPLAGAKAFMLFWLIVLKPWCKFYTHECIWLINDPLMTIHRLRVTTKYFCMRERYAMCTKIGQILKAFLQNIKLGTYLLFLILKRTNYAQNKQVKLLPPIGFTYLLIQAKGRIIQKLICR